MIEKDISQYLSLEQRARNLFGENYDLENCVEELRQYRDTTLSPEQVRTLQTRFVDVSLRLGEYMAIGTPEECRSAVEKQKAKTPDFEVDGSYGDYGGKIVYDTWICPGCGEHYEIDYDKHEYCPCCGQKLSWENNDVTK
jgi:rubrerythrin